MFWTRHTPDIPAARPTGTKWEAIFHFRCSVGSADHATSDHKAGRPRRHVEQVGGCVGINSEIDLLRKVDRSWSKQAGSNDRSIDARVLPGREVMYQRCSVTRFISYRCFCLGSEADRSGAIEGSKRFVHRATIRIGSIGGHSQSHVRWSRRCFVCHSPKSWILRITRHELKQFTRCQAQLRGGRKALLFGSNPTEACADPRIEVFQAWLQCSMILIEESSS